MTFKRVLTAVIVTALAAGTSAFRAADQAPGDDAGKDKPAAPAPPEAKKKDRFFGNRLALFLETRAGAASFHSIENRVSVTQDTSSVNSLDLSGGKTGQFTIGWTLPHERGQYLLTYTAVGDDSFSLEAEGLQRSYIPINAAGITAPQQLPWWHLTVKDGTLRSHETPPVWDKLTDDANGNGNPDVGEFRYPDTVLSLTTPTTKKLNNRLETYDLYYRRDFGGVRYHARWSAGVRYLRFQGALPTPTWLKSAIGAPGLGYSDGLQNQILVMSQDTKAWGPMGSGEMQFNFARRRFQIYMLVQAALMVEKLSTDSGPFTYLAAPAGGGIYLIPGAGRVQDDVSKSSWNTMFETGFRVRVMQGFWLYLALNRTGYLDTLLVPTDISIPANDTQIGLGTTGLFTTRDFVVTSATLGASFQF